MEWVISAASPVHCLETNIYATATQKVRNLLAMQRVTTSFDFLLDTIQPQVIVTHGIGARLHIESHLATRHIGAHVKCVDHFAFGWSRTCAQELGRWIRLMAEYSTRQVRPTDSKNTPNQFHR
jgi:hypothetical protein